jgi:hypothetical protein
MRTSWNICVEELQNLTVSPVALLAQQAHEVVKARAGVAVHDWNLRDRLLHCVWREIWEQVLVEYFLGDVPKAQLDMTAELTRGGSATYKVSRVTPAALANSRHHSNKAENPMIKLSAGSRPTNCKSLAKNIHLLLGMKIPLLFGE